MFSLLELIESLFRPWLKRIVYPLIRRLSGAPEIQYVGAVVLDANVRKSKLNHGHCHLMLGSDADKTKAGFQLAIYTRPPSRPGQIEFVQIVIPHRTRSPGPNGADQEFTSDGEWVLDGSDPHLGLTYPMKPPPPNRPWEASMEDSPSSACVEFIGAIATGALERVTANDHFRTFIMWRPNRFKGRYRIPLGHIRWRWEGEASITVDNEDCQGTANSATGDKAKWKLVSSADQPDPIKRVPNMIHRPRWQRTTGDLRWRDIT